MLGAGPELREIPEEILAKNGATSTTEAREFIDKARADGAVPSSPPSTGRSTRWPPRLREHPVASALLNPASGKAEQSLFWVDQETGVWLRARLDWLPNRVPGRRTIIPDYKTAVSADPWKFRSNAADYGYHMQHAMYLDAVEALGLANPAPAFVFIVQEKTAPYVVTVVEPRHGGRVARASHEPQGHRHVRRVPAHRLLARLHRRGGPRLPARLVPDPNRGVPVSTDVALHGQTQTGLSIDPHQSAWTEQQVATLRHIGVENATQGDLDVFFHVVRRTGLDPFARQIYMIGRWSPNGTKFTIQTGIDGFRLIGRRAANASGESIAVGAPEWAREDGQWMPVWSPSWGQPIAARVTIHRNGNPFTAIALFEEYKQTKRDGTLTQMWAQRPAGQIAKCAEALAWRMAFPQDLGGIYADEEMRQADRPAPAGPTPAGRVTASEIIGEPTPADADVVDAEVVANAPVPATAQQRKAVIAALDADGVDGTDKDAVLASLTARLGRPITSTSEPHRGRGRPDHRGHTVTGATRRTRTSRPTARARRSSARSHATARPPSPTGGPKARRRSDS
ncbi:phage recombination protein Bet [Cellulosimicrobium sp. Marseille-Q8652]